MKDQLKLLLQLQTIDAGIRDYEATIAALPAKIEPTKRDIAKLEALISAERGRIAENAKWKEEQAALIARETEALTQARAKLNMTRNTKEYAAATREIDHKRKSISDRDAELKKMAELTQSSTTQTEQRAIDIEQLKAQITDEEREIAAKVEQLRGEMQDSLAARDAVRSQLPEALLKDYTNIASRKGTALALIEKATCRGCHMGIPPQLANIVARMETIEHCPRCGRMIYRKEMLEPKVDAAQG